MSTSVTFFGAEHYGGGPPDGRQLSPNIGGTAAAGDILLVCAQGLAGNGGLIPTITDDTGLGTWVQDGTWQSGDANFRDTWFSKICVGGETTVTVDWGDSTNKTVGGVWLGTPTQPVPYLIDSGPMTFDGTNYNFTCSNPVRSDHETYVALAGFSGAGLNNAGIVDPPGASGGDTAFIPTLGTVVHWNDDEADNTTADSLSYILAPAQDYVAVGFYGIWSGEPESVEITGTGNLLLSGLIDLEATGGDVEITGTGNLLLGGTVALDSDGGELPVRGTGRLILGGRADLSGRVPFPQPIRIPEDHLGCGVYQAFAMTRGLGEIVTMLPFTELEWARILDDTSTASLTIDGVANPRAMARCCEALSELEPEEHELCIIRNGWRVWSGPMTDLSFPAEQCVIQASDLSWWLTARTIHNNINSVQQDLVNILVAYVQDAMAVENSAGLYATVLALAGQLGDRLVQQSDHQLASDVIGELARTGVDWTTIDRRMLLGPLLPQPAPFPGATPYPTLIDANFRIQPTILVSGSQGGNAWYVNGPADGAGDLIFGEYGPHFPATDDHVEVPAAPDYAEIEAQYGRIERVVTESRILDQPGIDANAQTRYELLKRPLVYISDGALLPSTPIPMEKLLPGSIANVHLSNVCRVIGEPYRIKQVAVKANSDGSEEVDVQWQPLGTGIVLDGEL